MPRKAPNPETRKHARPPEQVFAGKMENAYKSYRNLAVKLAVLSRHRATREQEARDAFNLFLDKMGSAIAAFHVSGAAAEAAKEPSLSEFLG